MRIVLLLLDLIVTIGALASATHAPTLAEAHFDAEMCTLGLAGMGLLWITEQR